MTKPSLSVIIPAFNEAARIIPTLESVVNYLNNQTLTWEILVVDDGSTDNTVPLAKSWSSFDTRIQIRTSPHHGKGWAVRHGMLNARGEIRFMCDADLAMPIKHLDQFLVQMFDGYDIVIGSRQIKGAQRFNEPISRHFIGRAFNRLVQLLVVREFYDTQCGFKCFKGNIAEKIFDLQQIKGFGFDVEILFIAKKLELRVLEIPVNWYYQKCSKVRPLKDSFAMFYDIIKLRWHDMVNKQYSLHQ